MINVQVQRWCENELISINYVTVEFEGNTQKIDYKRYKAALS